MVKLRHLYPYIALICGCLACYRERERIRRLLNSCLRLHSVASISRTHPNARPTRVNSVSDEIVGNSTAVSIPSTSGFRNRTLKSNSTIWKAAEEGDVEQIERHIKSGVDVNAYSPSHGTPLSVAAGNVNSDVVRWLLIRRAKMNGCYIGYQETALHSAAEQSQETVVLSLLEHDADVNAQVMGVSAAYLACLKGHWTSVRILSDFGADERVSLNPTTWKRSVFDMILTCALHDIAGPLDKRLLAELAATCDYSKKSLQILKSLKMTVSEQWQCVENLHSFWRELTEMFCRKDFGEDIFGLFFYLRFSKGPKVFTEILELLNQFCILKGWDEDILKEACGIQSANIE